MHDMASAVDYRRLARHAAGVYFLAPDRGDALHAAFLEAGEISGNGGGRGGVGQPGPATVDVAMGRTLVVPQALGAHMLCVQLHTTICRAVLRMLYAMYHVRCYVLHVTTCPCESPPFAAFPCCPWSVQSPLIPHHQSSLRCLTEGNAALFSFQELCDKPLAAADYIALASAFNTVALTGVPRFGAANRAAAYRIVTRIDV